MTRYLLDTNAMGHLINRRRGVDARARQAVLPQSEPEFAFAGVSGHTLAEEHP